MKRYNLSNGHSITVEKSCRGVEGEYLIKFYEDDRRLNLEYAKRDYIEWFYDITL